MKRAQAAAAAHVNRIKSRAFLLLIPWSLKSDTAWVQLVDTTKGGDLLERISLIRRQIAIEFGVVVPPIRIRDNMQIGPNDYVIKLRGNPLASWPVLPGQYLAMDSGAATGQGQRDGDEGAGVWPAGVVDSGVAAGRAEMLNYTVVEAAGVLATHITEVIKSHAYELVTREEVTALLKQLKEKCPTLVEEVIPSAVKPGELQKILQNLLRERVPIRDLETILEVLGEWAGKTKDLDVLSEAVRHGLARGICQQYKDEQNTIHCVTMDPQLEDTINGYIRAATNAAAFLTLPPQLAKQITDNIGDAREQIVAARIWRRGLMLAAGAPVCAAVDRGVVARGHRDGL